MGDAPERAVFELASPVPRHDRPVLELLHQDDGVQDARDRRGRQERAPDERIRRRHVVQQLRRAARRCEREWQIHGRRAGT